MPPKKQALRKNARERTTRARLRLLELASNAEQRAAWWESECQHPAGKILRQWANITRLIAPLLYPPAETHDPALVGRLFKCLVIAQVKSSGGAGGVYRRAAEVLNSLPSFGSAEPVDPDGLRLFAREHAELVAYFEPPIGVKPGKPLTSDFTRLIRATPRNSCWRAEIEKAIQRVCGLPNRNGAA